MDNHNTSEPLPGDLLDAFRTHYLRFERLVTEATTHATDSTVLARLGDELDEYTNLVNEHATLFSTEELTTIRTNLGVMQTDIRIKHQEALDLSHHGRPTVIETVHTGNRGRPRVSIDPEFLRWAYSHRTVSGIAHFLGVHRDTVRNSLLEHGIVEPQANPFASPPEEETVDVPPLDLENDELLDPHFVLPETLPPDIQPPTSEGANVTMTNSNITSFTGPLSNISDTELDDLIIQLRQHYRRAGVSMLDGMLRRLNHRVPRERIRASLMRIDPVQRVFQRIQIRRRVYSVAGPMALWHHDGQHGLIRWGIVIHGFIDGYSRLITGLRASDNNFGATVLNLFLAGSNTYGVPSRIRGDHGVENILLAAWMELYRGERRGSYIWGRSVHNVRIERLWVDVTAQVGAAWADFFTTLELRHDLDINNVNHIWLLHYLFLPAINIQLQFFAEAWNQHKLQIRDGPNRSPADLFGFDMMVYGVRGYQLPHEEAVLSDDELEVYGVDWDGLHDDQLLRSLRENNSSREGSTSWIRRAGPPQHLNEVPVQPPSSDALTPAELAALAEAVGTWYGLPEDENKVLAWSQGLGFARAVRGDVF